MDFSLTEEQELLVASVRRFAADRLGSDSARAAMAGEWKQRDACWRQLAEMGLLGILVPEEDGGSGGSLLDACLVAEEISAALGSLPYWAHAVGAGAALWLSWSSGERKRLAEDVCSGRPVSLVLGRRNLDWPYRGGEGVALPWAEGAALIVPDGSGARALRYAAVAPATCRDPLLPLGRVESLELSVAPDFDRREDTRRYLAALRVAASAAMVGSMAGALELTRSYAAQREQFDRKITSFQAIRHMFSDMLVDLESSRSAVYGAAWAVENADLASAVRLAAVAKTWCSEAAVRVCEAALQIHGGIGFTWEADVHLHLRASHFDAGLFGGVEAAVAEVAAGIVDEAGA